MSKGPVLRNKAKLKLIDKAATVKSSACRKSQEHLKSCKEFEHM